MFTYQSERGSEIHLHDVAQKQGGEREERESDRPIERWKESNERKGKGNGASQLRLCLELELELCS